MIACFFQKRPQYSWPISPPPVRQTPIQRQAKYEGRRTPDHRNRLLAALKANVRWMST